MTFRPHGAMYKKRSLTKLSPSRPCDKSTVVLIGGNSLSVDGASHLESTGWDLVCGVVNISNAIMYQLARAWLIKRDYGVNASHDVCW